MKKLSYSLVDVFTDAPLSGNPLAVFTLQGDVPTPLMQRIAREMNLSETTFVSAPKQGGTAHLRIFTPTREIPFAGHPLIGTAYVIGRAAPLGLVRFETGVGVIDVEIEREGGFVSQCVMTQPKVEFSPFALDHDTARAALGVAPTGPCWLGSNGATFVLVPVADVDAVTPDMGAIARLPHAVGVYEPPREGVARQRLFAPSSGVPEDPVTGSLSGVTATRLLLDGAIAPGLLTIVQGAHVGRPGRVYVTVAHDRAPRVGGTCVSIARGHMELATFAV